MTTAEQRQDRGEKYSQANSRVQFARLFHIATTYGAAYTVDQISKAQESGKQLSSHDIRYLFPAGDTPAMRRTHTRHVGSLYVANCLLDGVLDTLGVIRRNSDYRYSLLPGTEKAVEAARIALAFYEKSADKTRLPTNELFRNATAHLKSTGELASTSFARAELLLHIKAKGNLNAEEIFAHTQQLYPPQANSLYQSFTRTIMARLGEMSSQGVLQNQGGSYILTEAGKLIVDYLLSPLAQLAGYDPTQEPQPLES